MVRLYYWKGRPNFGDALAPLLLKKFTKLDSEWAPPDQSDLVLVGSIAEHLPKDYDGVIAGIGKLHEETKLSFPNAQILGFRGPLSARGIRGRFIIGDPALLANELVPLEDKQYDLGLVPHWTDTQLEKIPVFRQFNPKIIRVTDDPLKVITEISQCKKIVSSSLHGIIIADAFNIPRRIELAPDMINKPKQEGGVFKFLDYSASLGVELVIGMTQEIDRNKVRERQHEVFDLFREVKKRFKD